MGEDWAMDAQKIRLKANQIYNRLQSAFTVPDGGNFWNEFECKVSLASTLSIKLKFHIYESVFRLLNSAMPPREWNTTRSWVLSWIPPKRSRIDAITYVAVSVEEYECLRRSEKLNATVT